MTNSLGAWGQDTKFFFELTPDIILREIETACKVRCTGRVLTLNSMENRVYEVELEEGQSSSDITGGSSSSFIVKFYRPGRWSKEQILEEHQFLVDLQENEIPVVAPLKSANDLTLEQCKDSTIYFAIFPKIMGRSPDELQLHEFEQIGRLLGRMHKVGSSRNSRFRLSLDPQTYGIDHLDYLINESKLPSNLIESYECVVREICKISFPLFMNTAKQRIHGDCHLGNLLRGKLGLFWVDFDDMVNGPPVQDLWLLLPDRSEASKRQLDLLLKGYETMNNFDDSSLKLIESLRALRFIHFNAWIAKRWDDPAFKNNFAYFGTENYWKEQIADLRDQLDLMSC